MPVGLAVWVTITYTYMTMALLCFWYISITILRMAYFHTTVGLFVWNLVHHPWHSYPLQIFKYLGYVFFSRQSYPFCTHFFYVIAEKSWRFAIITLGKYTVHVLLMLIIDAGLVHGDLFNNRLFFWKAKLRNLLIIRLLVTSFHIQRNFLLLSLSSVILEPFLRTGLEMFFLKFWV